MTWVALGAFVAWLVIALPLAAITGRHLRWARRTQTRQVEFTIPPGPDGGHRLRRIK